MKPGVQIYKQVMKKLSAHRHKVLVKGSCLIKQKMMSWMIMMAVILRIEQICQVVLYCF
jgi:hypothetical protein